MTWYPLGTVKGTDGTDGKGIRCIQKTSTSGLVDTYTIYYTDGTSTTYEVTNGEDGGGGSADIVTEWETTLSDEKVPSEKLTKNSLDNHGHGNLSKDGKLGTTSGKPVITTTGGSITTGAFGTSSGQFAEGNHTHSGYLSATKVTSWSGTVSDDNVPSEKLVKNSIPTKISDLTNDSDFIETSSTAGLIKNDGSIDTSSYLTEMKIGTTSGLPVKTGSSGALTTGSFGTSAGTFAEGNHTHSGMLTTSDIYDGLDSSATNKALSAKQGKALNDLIGDAITYINL